MIAATRKILVIEVKAWNLMQMFLNLCWGEFLRETCLKPTRLIMSAFFRLYFQRVLNNYISHDMKLWSENTSISKYFHFKNMKWRHIFRQRIQKSDTFISFSQQCSGSLIVLTFQDVSKCCNYSVNLWIYYCLIFLCFRKEIT